jgi:hypothetical protein
MQRDHQPVLTPARRVCTVVPGGEVFDRAAQFPGEGGPVGSGRETDLGVDGERGDRLTGGPGPGDQLAHLPDQPCGQAEQPPGGQLIRRPAGVGCHVGQRGRGDHIRGGGRSQHPFSAISPPALGDQLDQAVPLQRVEVIVDLLPG